MTYMSLLLQKAFYKLQTRVCRHHSSIWAAWVSPLTQVGLCPVQFFVGLLVLFWLLTAFSSLLSHLPKMELASSKPASLKNNSQFSSILLVVTSLCFIHKSSYLYVLLSGKRIEDSISKQPPSGYSCGLREGLITLKSTFKYFKINYR